MILLALLLRLLAEPGCTDPELLVEVHPDSAYIGWTSPNCEFAAGITVHADGSITIEAHEP